MTVSVPLAQVMDAITYKRLNDAEETARRNREELATRLREADEERWRLLQATGDHVLEAMRAREGVERAWPEVHAKEQKELESARRADHDAKTQKLAAEAQQKEEEAMAEYADLTQRLVDADQE